MKKALITYAVIFALTIAVPALVCFAVEKQSTNQELINIFRQNISLLDCYR